MKNKNSSKWEWKWKWKWNKSLKSGTDNEIKNLLNDESENERQRRNGIL